MPAVISSWMWAVWANTYGQKAKSTADVTAAPLSPVKRRTNSHVNTNDDANASRP